MLSRALTFTIAVALTCTIIAVCGGILYLVQPDRTSMKDMAAEAPEPHKPKVAAAAKPPAPAPVRPKLSELASPPVTAYPIAPNAEIPPGAAKGEAPPPDFVAKAAAELPEAKPADDVPVSPEAPEERHVTRANYGRLVLNMGYTDVVRILGFGGKELSQFRDRKTVRWTSRDGRTVITVVFQGVRPGFEPTLLSKDIAD